MKTKIVATTIACLLMATAAPAHADSTDDAYLAALSAEGINLGPEDNSSLIAIGHALCQDATTGSTRTADALHRNGVGTLDTITILTTAHRIYCPSTWPTP